MDTLDLYSRPTDEQFTEKEIAFLKSKVPKSNYRLKYAIRKKSNRNLYITVIIDCMAYSSRRTVAYNSYDVICERPLTDLEFHEEMQNYGSGNRILRIYEYYDIDHLIREDIACKSETPQNFIDYCNNNGY